MAYQVTARKWRPQRFSDMVGQEHIARTLRNAIVTGRIAHAYLFVGPRGIGKTTSARIFAKALNCEHPVDGEPCCECASCKAIADESSVDVIEIDAATHTQVEKARDICEDVLHLPIASKYKIYIIDEVHMLSKSAWNALLKTIEEPPAHAKFIFATTEVNKVLPTVISRCQRFDLCRIPSELIAQRLAYIASEEKINISRSALDVIARAADGGMRDAQSLLDQLVSFFGNTSGDETISEAQALSLFGLTAPGEMEELLKAILSNDRTSAILSIHQFAGQGKNLETLFEEILTWLRGILLCLVLPEPQNVLDENLEKINSYRKLAALTNPDTLQILMEQLAASSYLLREAINKQVFMETILLKAMRAAHAVRVEDLLIRLNQIRKNGELAGIEKVPTLAQIPVAPVYVPVSPVQQNTVQSVPAAAEPMLQKPETPCAAPVTEQSVKPVQAAPAPAPEKIPEPAAQEKVTPEKEPVTEQSVNMSETAEPPVMPETYEPAAVSAPSVPAQTAPAEMTESSVNAPSNAEPTIAEEIAEEAEEDEQEAVQEDMELSAQAENHGHGSSMSLKERFSPELLWTKLTEVIQYRQPSLAGMMQDGMPDRIENSLLHVLFDEKDGSMVCAALNEAKPLLQQELKELTGDKYADLTLRLKKGLHSEETPKRKLEELKRDVADNPLVKETSDLFAGVIVDVFE
mgnify:FL=1